MKNLRKSVKDVLLSISIGLGVLLLLAVAGVIVYDYATRVPFSSAAWKAAKTSPDGVKLRGRMTASLFSQHELVGMSKSQILALLGEPDQESDLSGWDMGYTVGYSIIDPIMLVFEFDAQWLVVKYDEVTFG